MRKSISIGIGFAILCGGAAVPSVAQAQPAGETGWTSMEYIRNSDPWLTNGNASGLSVLSVEKVSSLGLFYQKGDGKFVNYFESDDQYRFGAEAESFYRLNPGVVFYGKVDYSSFKGKNMGGASFIDPYYNPFNVVESTDPATRGEKKMENYHLAGAVSAALNSRFVIGGSLDYTAANLAKLRDPRHENEYMNLVASLGFKYVLSGRITAGANASFRRSVEGIEYSTYVGTELPYTSFINFGSFYGKTENFNSSGYTVNNARLPVVNHFFGGNVQADVELNERLSFFNDFSYKSRSGYYGKKGTGSVRYTDHKGTIFSYSGTISYKKGTALHTLAVGLGSESLGNKENIYKYVTQPGGRVDVVNYGDSEILDKDMANAGVDYKGYLGLKGNMPAWVLNAGGGYFSYDQTTSVYPFFRKQSVRQYTVYAGCERNIFNGNNLFTVAAGLNYGGGGGTAKEDGLYATPSDSQASPAGPENLLMREFEYLTAARFGGYLGIGYSRRLDNGMQAYARLNYKLTAAPDIDYLDGKTAQAIEIKIGCSF